MTDLVATLLKVKRLIMYFLPPFKIDKCLFTESKHATYFVKIRNLQHQLKVSVVVVVVV
jgi:hypothetical protein